MAWRVQKFIAAKAAATKKGRDLIKGLLGDHGEKLIDSILSFAEQDKGKEFSQKLEKYIFKVTSKCVVLIHNRKLNPEVFRAMVEPSSRFCWALVDQCELSMVMFAPDPLIEFMKSLASFLQSTLKTLITGKTMERIQFLCDYFANIDTLTKFIKSETYRDLKGDFSMSLMRLLGEMDVSREAPEPHESKEREFKMTKTRERSG